MASAREGSFRLFRFAGIDVFLHWSWFLIAAYEVMYRKLAYSSPAWNAVEYVALFAIVTLHEFGHALACRSVGGRADTIVLWPLGGVAYVDPPQRPGAVLWSIAAGPLVNVFLVPVLVGAFAWARSSGLRASAPDEYQLLRSIMYTNIGLLIYNMLPVYPLDGGQIVRALLWFFIGRARSLMVASLFGFVGVAALAGLAFWMQSLWLGILAFFSMQRCISGYQQSKALQALAEAPRRAGFACPSCHAAPPGGPYWGCPRCRIAFDTFETGGACPQCRTPFATTSCPDCGASNPIVNWILPPPAG